MELQQLKVSRFNARTTTDDGTLMLYNSATGAIIAVPPDMSQEVSNILKRDAVHTELTDIHLELAEGGYLTPVDTDENDVLEGIIGERMNNSELHLIILPTEDCNFRCVYCYESFKRGAMSQDLQDSIVTYLEKNIEKYESIYIEWFGGDPLHAPDVVLSLGKRLFDITHAHGKEWKSHMTTNGYNLTPELAPELFKIGITNLTITIDGLCDDHDSRRVLNGGGGTFERIMDNLQYLKTTDLEFRIRIRHNFDPDSLQRAHQFIEFLGQEFGHDERFNDVNIRSISKWGGENDENLDVCDAKTARKSRYELLSKALDHGLVEKGLKWYVYPSKYVCYASDPNSFVIGSDGKLMKCTIELDNHDRNIIGQVEKDGIFTIDTGKVAEWVLSGTEDATCKSCYFAPACQGAACAKARFDTGVRPCPDDKVYIQEVLKLVYKEARVLNYQ